MARPRTVCDIRELPSMAALRTWAAVHDVAITYAGPDVFARPVYVARAGGVERVARGVGRDPHTMPLVWRSPLERSPRSRPSRPHYWGGP